MRRNVKLVGINRFENNDSGSLVPAFGSTEEGASTEFPDHVHSFFSCEGNPGLSFANN